MQELLQSPSPYYSKLKILKLHDQCRIEVAKYVHRFIHNSLPTSFSRYYIKTNQVSSRTTRAASNKFNLNTPRYLSNHLQRSIKYNELNSIMGRIINGPYYKSKLEMKSNSSEIFPVNCKII